MATERETTDRMRAIVRHFSNNQSKAADALGVHRATVGRILNEDQAPSEETLAAMERLEQSGIMETPRDGAGARQNYRRASQTTDERRVMGDRHLPVYGLAAGSTIGQHVMSDDPVEYVSSPMALDTVKDAYALIVTGSSMSPAYEPGDYIFLHPYRTPRPGDYIAIQEMTDAGIVVSIKRFLKLDDEWLLTQQFNPQSEVKFRRDRILACHRVLRSNELFGL
ncbi:S24 family peptidase [Notoacmeibacter sp. MSK16QG-6]|uniref:S24 family peptidase n=1 Tax=Notoacmeibacter sp. MSK16QG-6 TaxID=2957982 RepID=UPI0020A0B438|nr:S24 family peptidase [Notoacmeibacter sp. MSK16QG-6]MCP1200085.1 helix-turn-helix domain-containing protein [Notoacmeibacter sp. MSK16QG-6]